MTYSGLSLLYIHREMYHLVRVAPQFILLVYTTSVDAHAQSIIINIGF